MNSIRLLMVEDDQGIQDMMSFALEDDGYQLTTASSVKQAWQCLENNQYEIVLLDWMLPDSSGIDLLRRIRKKFSKLPVIMLTAKTEEHDRIKGLDTGADDYVTKPFSVQELKLRIQAVIRRSMPEKQDVKIGDLHIDPVSQRVRAGDVNIDLPPTEFKLLHYFMTHEDRVFSRSQLLDQVWGQNVYVEERTVDVHIRRLRKNLAPFNMDIMLQTVHGSGYRFSRL